ncbi:MAG: hypothetical protein WA633_27170 [Stellaceae bacterium]
MRARRLASATSDSPNRIVAELAAAAELLGKQRYHGKFTAAAFRYRIGAGRKLAIRIP